MLFNLKQQLKQDAMNEVMLESMTNNVDFVKSIFLDGFEADVLGAENDPEVKSLVETLPEYDDHDDQLEMEIQTMTESLVETQI